MPTLLQDLRFALRVLSKNPSFTAVAVVTLSLGIGATAAVFNLIQGVLLTPPPYPNPEQVVLISPVRIDRQPYVRGCLTGQWLEWQKEAKSFGTIAAYFWNFNILIRQDGSESIQGMHVTKGYFRVLGIKPVMGREFLPSEYPVPGATTFDTQRETAIILGYELWQRRFDGDPNIIGKTIHLSRHQAPLTVVGVMPPGVRFLPTPSAAQEPNYDVNARVDYWAPASPDETKPKEDSWTVVGRLRDGATLTQAQAELTRIAARQAEVEPDFEGITAKAQPLIVELNREERRLLLPLFGIVTLVFFIACANATGLLLARGLQRQQEYAVRCALGARRVQLFRQVLTESLLLAVLGGVFGAGLTFGNVKLLIIVAGPAIPRLDSVTVSWPMLGFCLGTSVLAAALAGLVPAFRASQMQPAYGLRGAGPTASAGRADRLLLRG